MTTHAVCSIRLFRPMVIGFLLTATLRTFTVNFKRAGMQEYKINEDGLVMLRCALEPDGRTLRTENCPFCGVSHIHGLSAGHKVSHCGVNVVITLPDGNTVSNFGGYILELVRDLEIARHKRKKIMAYS